MSATQFALKLVCRHVECRVGAAHRTIFDLNLGICAILYASDEAFQSVDDFGFDESFILSSDFTWHRVNYSKKRFPRTQRPGPAAFPMRPR